MKNYSLKYITLFLILSLGFAGCDEFLEENPETFISPNAYYRNAEDAQSAINAVYAILPRFYQGIAYGESVFFTLEMPSDQADSGTGVSVVDQDRLDAYIYDPAIRHLRLWWQYSYQGINAANSVLYYVPEIDMSENAKARILSEAYYLRAYFYFDLVRLFGAVPLTVEPTLNISNVNLTREDVTVIYDQIIQDLINAEHHLPVAGSIEAEHGRATKGAASTLLAKVYLTLERWEEASNKAEEVVNSGAYQLFDDYADAFDVENKNGKEHIFSIQFERTINSSNFHAWFLPRYRGIQANTEEFGAILPNMEFYNSYSDDDYRKAANFIQVIPQLMDLVS
ncbi:RagB/SusD family nutrient uptake outer membrane protein [Cyclobacterium roseum]|uniref:RagB/SusD family nutrient uptake outer membrane protein n=1 Tax=Cyclobacterium roseum TaxID=2666137 RepID=UPI001391381A|nr:RagB/SusD family nutrient uptake outer membrane protein [Cyclobacterium roseum]